MRFDNENISDKNPVGLRLPTELKEKIKNAAKENQQSMNAEIVRRLDASFEHEENFNALTNRQKNNVLGMIEELKNENRKMFEELKSAFERK